jgi:hypothetical protein
MPISQKEKYNSRKCTEDLYRRLVQYFSSKITLKRYGLSIEGMGITFAYPDGATLYVWNNCPTNTPAECSQSRGDCHRKQSNCVPYSMSSRNTTVGQTRWVYVGRNSQIGHNRLGGLKARIESPLILESN